MTKKIYVAKETFHTVLDGVPVTVSEGERVRAGHELLKGREQFFEAQGDEVEYEVEQATASPGEKRGAKKD